MEDPQKRDELGKMGTDQESCTQDSRPRSPINGQPLPVGRQKGQVNKLTKTFKAAAEMAFEKGGGVDWLVKMMNGTASDRAAVLGLFGRLIPHQLVGNIDHKVKVELSWLGQRGIAKDTLDMESPAAIANDPSKSLISNGMGNVTEVVDAVVRQPRDSEGQDHVDSRVNPYRENPDD